jgi:predicted SprT family Zn-dependent metalloprotease
MRAKDAVTKRRQLVVADHVTFAHNHEAVQGALAKKGRTHAYVITADRREFRVPYHQLEKVGGAVDHPVLTATDQRRAALHAGDAVQFGVRGSMISGVLVRLNPARAHVVGEDGTEYRVPYTRLERVAGAASRVSTARAAAHLATIAHWAAELMAAHGLQGWSFQFDNSTTRAGACQYATRVLSLSFAFARQAPEEEIRETLLHEIAHALVGHAHHHDAVWRAQAREIGSSGHRCHELRFSPPRYIVTCERGCWVATAERQRRGVCCKRCRGTVVYRPYTEEQWNRACPRATEETETGRHRRTADAREQRDSRHR